MTVPADSESKNGNAQSPCPSCGREYPASEGRCRFCGSARHGRTPTRQLMLWTYPLLLAAAYHLIAAWVARPHYQAISSLSESDTFKRVRAQGRVSRVRTTLDAYRAGALIEFTVLDESDGGSGQMKPRGGGVKPVPLKVKAEGRIGTQLIEEDRVPVEGDVIGVVGPLYIGTGYRVLAMNSAAGCELLQASPNRISYDPWTVKALQGAKPLGKSVVIQRAVMVSRGRFDVTIRDPGDAQDSGGSGKPGPTLTVFGADPVGLGAGDVVSVRGELETYGKSGGFQIRTSYKDAANLVLLEKRSTAPFEQPTSVHRAVPRVSVANLLKSPKAFSGRLVKIVRARVVTCQSRFSILVTDADGPTVDDGDGSPETPPSGASERNPSGQSGPKPGRLDPERQLLVFGVDPTQYDPGDLLRLEGSFEHYPKGDSWQLKIPFSGGRRKGVTRNVRRILAAIPDRKTTTIAQLLEDPDRFAGVHVRIKNAVISQIHDERLLEVSDVPGKPTMKVFGASTRFLQVGQQVTVRGRFIQYASENTWEIKVRGGDYAAVLPLQDAGHPSGRGSGGRTGDKNKAVKR